VGGQYRPHSLPEIINHKEIDMNVFLAILILTVLCMLAFRVVFGILLRVIVFATCLIGALLLREFVAELAVSLFPVNLVVAEIAAFILLHLALGSVLRRCLQRAGSANTLSRWQVIGTDLVSVAMPVSLLLAGFGGIFLSAAVVWHGTGLFMVFVAAIMTAGLDMVFPRAFWVLSDMLWGPCGGVKSRKEMVK